MSYKLYDMGTVTISVRELQQHLKQVLARVERGQVVEVTRRRKPVARLAPVHPATETSPWPDLTARAQAVFGARVLESGGISAISEGRGER
jgi:prevent-host-death family protein